MTPHLLEQATKLIPNPPVLINVVSRRVRQLSHGHRAMVETGVRNDYADTALREIIAGKLDWEELPLPEVVEE